MLKTKKWPAYTLMELIIIMVLTGILSAITFSAIGLFTKNFFMFQKITRRSYELTLLYKLLLKDIDASQQVEYPNENTILCKYADKAVTYEFDPQKILRRGGIIDTFHFANQNFKYELLPSSDKVVQELRFELVVNEQILPYSFRKEYPADIFVNQNQENP